MYEVYLFLVHFVFNVYEIFFHVQGVPFFLYLYEATFVIVRGNCVAVRDHLRCFWNYGVCIVVRYNFDCCT